jgi:hypothetical protein
LKQALIILIVLTSILSCKESNNKLEIKIKTVKPIAENFDFGFNYSEFNVVQDTIKKGDNFGTIISKQNIGDRKVFEIVKVLEIL